MPAAAAAAHGARANRKKHAKVAAEIVEDDGRPMSAWQKANLARLPYQLHARRFYKAAKTQKFVALLICFNFLCTIAEKQFDPPMGDNHEVVWGWFEDLFNVVFLMEITINYWGHAYFEFFTSSWNVFDLIVCTMGALSLARVQLPPPWTLLRCFRAFRVFRLFKRIPSLNKIMVSLAKAVPGVINAFVIMAIVMSIYAIIAVEFFAEFGRDGYYNSSITDKDGHTQTVAISAETARGYYYGNEYYGAFDRALYTLWQVLTGESWSEAIARPLIFGVDENYAPSSNAGIASLFFVSFLMINGIVLINVVVAVLLEKMVSDPEEEDDEEEGSDDERGDETAERKVTCDPVYPVHVNGKAVPEGGDVSVLKARLDRMDARFDEQQALLEKVLAALNQRPGAKVDGGVKVDEF